MKIIEGDICDAKEKYILHQCNCVSHGAKGVAKAIFERYPYSNTYKYGIRKPGTIDIMDGEKIIINVYAQYYPGLCKYNDTKEMRLKWFEECIDKVLMLNINEIAIPYNIGCGHAGGDFEDYLKILQKLDEKINITLYKL